MVQSAGYGEYQSAPESPWKKFENVLGKSVRSKEVKQFITDHKLVKKPGYDIGATDFGLYEGKPEESPVSLTYRNGKIWRVSVVVTNDSKSYIKPYRDDIPLSVARGDTPKEAIAKLGPPASSSGPRWLKYPQMGIEFLFQEGNEQLYAIYLVEKDTPPSK